MAKPRTSGRPSPAEIPLGTFGWPSAGAGSSPASGIARRAAGSTRSAAARSRKHVSDEPPNPSRARRRLGRRARPVPKPVPGLRARLVTTTRSERASDLQESSGPSDGPRTSTPLPWRCRVACRQQPGASKTAERSKWRRDGSEAKGRTPPSPGPIGRFLGTPASFWNSPSLLSQNALETAGFFMPEARAACWIGIGLFCKRFCTRLAGSAVRPVVRDARQRTDEAVREAMG
jgi:hypothetical protein